MGRPRRGASRHRQYRGSVRARRPYALVPDQYDHEWQDDGGEVPADGDGVPSDGIEAPDSLQESDDYRWEDHNDLPPDPVEVRPLRARPLAAGGIADSIVGMQMPEFGRQTRLRTKQAVTGPPPPPQSSPWCVALGWYCAVRAPPPINRLPSCRPPARACRRPAGTEQRWPRVSAPLLPRLPRLRHHHPRQRPSR